jgi:MFS family permease
LLGGWLLEVSSWRSIFFIVAPFAIIAGLLGTRVLPTTAQTRSIGAIDYPGAALATLGFSGVITFFIVGPAQGFDAAWLLGVGVAGAALLVLFVLREAHTEHPLLPLDLFHSRTFTGANITTLFVYAALSGLFFLLMLQLQNALGWSPLRAGASLLPINLLLLVLSPIAGQLADRGGARWLMSGGAFVAGVGMLLFTRVQPGSTLVGHLVPALAVFGLGLAALVAPLTATVLAAAPAERKGIASAFNNAVARLAGLIATAALPLAAGMGALSALEGTALVEGFAQAMRICAALCFLGAVVAFFTVGQDAAKQVPSRRAAG